MARMIGKTAIQCEQGCCRIMWSQRKKEKRMLKRRERHSWRKEVGNG